MKDFFKDETVIFGNLGGVTSFPPGTLPCYEEGFRMGANAACVNVQLSKDNVVMAVPSDRIDGLCEGTGAVSEYTFQELKEFDAGYSFPGEEGDYPFRGKGLNFLSLRELIKTFPDRKFSINLMHKSTDLADEYCRIIKEEDAEKRIITASMYGKVIKRIRKELPESATAFSLAGIIGVYALFRTGLLWFVRNFSADVMQTPEAIGVSYIANRGLIRELQKRGVKVQVWHIAGDGDMKRIHDAGADGFMSDDIMIILRYLSRI